MRIRFLLLLLSSCASLPPGDRSQSQKEYEKEEALHLESSRRAAALSSQLGALESRKKAIKEQILTQERVIRRWREQRNVPSSRAMIANAEARVRHLEKEEAALEAEIQALSEELSQI